MLTALPYRFYFEAIGLAGFRVPQKNRPVQARALYQMSGTATCDIIP